MVRFYPCSLCILSCSESQIPHSIKPGNLGESLYDGPHLSTYVVPSESTQNFKIRTNKKPGGPSWSNYFYIFPIFFPHYKQNIIHYHQFPKKIQLLAIYPMIVHKVSSSSSSLTHPVPFPSLPHWPQVVHDISTISIIITIHFSFMY